MQDSRNLRVLDAAEDFAATVALLSTRIAADVLPAARNQLVRAAAATAANIAEAANLGTDANFRRQLQIALASATECGSHLRLIKRTNGLDPLSVARCESKRVVVSKMLVALIRSIEEREARGEDRRRRRSAPQ